MLVLYLTCHLKIGIETAIINFIALSDMLIFNKIIKDTKALNHQLSITILLTNLLKEDSLMEAFKII